ncbi:MAG TPA: hypothetical protein VIQ98_08120 [Gemmatimonadales bacterium]
MRGHLSRAGWLVVLALGGRSIVAAAQAPTVTVGGVGYAQFAYHPTDTANYANTFEVTRAYINVVGRFAHGVTVRITPDIYRTSDGLTYRLKYGFVTWTPDSGAITFKLGMLNTPYVEWEEQLWDYRMQGTTAMDRNGYLSSSDIGFLVDGNWGNEAVSMSAGVINGENYNRPLGDKGKDLTARVSVRLMATDEASRTGGLRLTGYGHTGKPTGGGVRQRLLGVLSYRSKLLTLAGVGAVTKDSALTTPVTPERQGRVLSGFGVLRVPPSHKLQFIGRVDSIDPNTDADDDRQTRFIVGIGYQLTPNLRLLADLDKVNYQGGVTTPALEVVRSQALFQVQFTF